MNILYDKIKLLSLQHKHRIKEIDKPEQKYIDIDEDEMDYVHFTEAFMNQKRTRRSSSGSNKKKS